MNDDKLDIHPAYHVFLESKYLVHSKLHKKHVRIELGKIGEHRPSLILRALVQNKPTSFYHRRKQAVMEEIQKQPLSDSASFRTTALARRIRFEPMRRKAVHRYVAGTTE